MTFFSKLFKGGKSKQTNLKDLIDKGAIIVDVRSSGEFRSGNAKGSENIPLQSIANHTDKLRNKTVVVVCKSGVRSARAKSILSKMDIPSYNGGAWQNVDF